MTKRRVNEIRNDLDNIRSSINNNKKYIATSIIADIILSILYYIFVVGKGTKFDHSASILVLSFFVIIAISNSFKLFRNIPNFEKVKREYMIATETPEQRMKRERSEKLSRVLKEETE